MKREEFSLALDVSLNTTRSGSAGKNPAQAKDANSVRELHVLTLLRACSGTSITKPSRSESPMHKTKAPSKTQSTQHPKLQFRIVLCNTYPYQNETQTRARGLRDVANSHHGPTDKYIKFKKGTEITSPDFTTFLQRTGKEEKPHRLSVQYSKTSKRFRLVYYMLKITCIITEYFIIKKKKIKTQP